MSHSFRRLRQVQQRALDRVTLRLFRPVQMILSLLESWVM